MKPRKEAAVGDLFAPGAPPPMAQQPSGRAERAGPAGGTLFERMCAIARGNAQPQPAEVDQAAGIQQGIEGAEAARAHADGVSTVGDTTWSEKAFAFTRRWVARQSIDSTFALENVRIAWEAEENPLPPNNNAWGAIARRMVRDKIAVPAGFGQATIKSSNGRAVALYRPFAGTKL